MNQKTIRNVAFSLHRYVGLIVGMILIIVGLTGSLLVFQEEIDHFLVNFQFGEVIPQGQRLTVESIVQVVQKACDNSGFKLSSIELPLESDTPILVRLNSPATCNVSTNNWRPVSFIDFLCPERAEIHNTFQSISFRLRISSN